MINLPYKPGRYLFLRNKDDDSDQNYVDDIIKCSIKINNFSRTWILFEDAII